MTVEEDGDEILIPLEKVKCCTRWEGQKQIVYPLEARRLYGRFWACCSKCGGSFGEVNEGWEPCTGTS